MTLFKALLIALSTYSIILVPQFEWDEKNMKYSICFLPVVGIFCGALIFLWYHLCNKLGISSLLFSVVSVSIPVLITGGIHLDGFMDTVDAISSHQPTERKLEILKDSHCGAFAVIYCVVYFILSIAFLSELYELKSIAVICPVFVLSRILSVLCAVNIKNARKKGMLNSYTENADKKTVNVIMAVLLAAVLALIVVISFVPGLFTVCFGLVAVLFYCRTVKKQFGGVTGDTAGFFLQICELLCITGALIGVMSV